MSMDNIESIEGSSENVSLDAVIKMTLDDSIEELDRATRSLNLFDVFGMARMEIRHSFALAWLLNPLQNPELAPRILRDLMKYALNSNQLNGISVEQKIKILDEGFKTALVWREWNHIDLLVEGEKAVFCIENKVDSAEHDDQLKQYKERVDSYCETHGNKQPIYLLLSPDEREAESEEDKKWWIPISYREILGFIERAKEKTTLPQTSLLMVENYLELLRREFTDMDEQEGKKAIALKFYQEHKDAIKYLFSLIPDDVSVVTENVRAWLRQYAERHQEIAHIIPRKDETQKGYVRFQTEKLNSLIGEHSGKSGWADSALYYYEIVINETDKGIRIGMQLAFCAVGCSKDEKDRLEKVYKELSQKDLRKEWLWRVVWSTNTSDKYTIRSLADLPEIGKEASPMYRKLEIMLKKLIENTEGKLIAAGPDTNTESTAATGEETDGNS